MKRGMLLFTALAFLLCGMQQAKAGFVIDKTPDLGPYWFSLDGSPNGTYVYANSFVFEGPTGSSLDTVGAYMLNLSGGPGTPFQFVVYADNAGAPNPAAVLGATGYQQDGNPALALITNSLTTPVSLVNGTQYWVALSTVGQESQGSYQVGGHTQNSAGIVDNGTFWYSNDPAGITFDGTNLTPEMAIYAAGTSSTPEPASLALLGLGAVGLMGFAWRRRTRPVRLA